MKRRTFVSHFHWKFLVFSLTSLKLVRDSYKCLPLKSSHCWIPPLWPENTTPPLLQRVLCLSSEESPGNHPRLWRKSWHWHPRLCVYLGPPHREVTPGERRNCLHPEPDVPWQLCRSVFPKTPAQGTHICPSNPQDRKLISEFIFFPDDTNVTSQKIKADTDVYNVSEQNINLYKCFRQCLCFH